MNCGEIKINISVGTTDKPLKLTDEQLQIVAQNYENAIDAIDFEAIIRNKLIEHGVGWVAWEINVQE